jgi:hypothetical protein
MIHGSFVRRFITRLAGFLALALATGSASAAHVCYVGHVAGSGSFGSEGYVYFSLFTSPNCTGAFVGTMYLCTTGATSSSCVASTLYRHERQSLLTHLRMLQQAATTDQRVATGNGACNGGSGSCTTVVNYYSD